MDQPGVPRLLAADFISDPAWYATEYGEALSLSDRATQFGPLDKHTVLALAGSVLETLSRLHLQGIVHRNLSPRSVLLPTTPARGGPLIIGFGRAGIPGAAEPGPGGQPPATMWSSPEHLRGEQVGAPSDIFSLALVLAFAATGRHPFDARPDMSPVEVADLIGRGTADLRGADEALGDLLAPLLLKSPYARPGAHEAAEHIRAGVDPLTAAAVAHASRALGWPGEERWFARLKPTVAPALDALHGMCTDLRDSEGPFLHDDQGFVSLYELAEQAPPGVDLVQLHRHMRWREQCIGDVEPDIVNVDYLGYGIEDAPGWWPLAAPDDEPPEYYPSEGEPPPDWFEMAWGQNAFEQALQELARESPLHLQALAACHVIGAGKPVPSAAVSEILGGRGHDWVLEQLVRARLLEDSDGGVKVCTELAPWIGEDPQTPAVCTVVREVRASVRRLSGDPVWAATRISQIGLAPVSAILESSPDSVLARMVRLQAGHLGERPTKAAAATALAWEALRQGNADHHELLNDILVELDGVRLAPLSTTEQPTRNLFRTLPGTRGASWIAWHGDAGRAGLLAVGVGPGVGLWDAETGTPMGKVTCPGGIPVTALAWRTQPGRPPLLATGGSDGRLLLWDMATGRLLRQLSAGDEEVTSLAWSGGPDSAPRLARGNQRPHLLRRTRPAIVNNRRGAVLRCAVGLSE